MNKLTAEFKDFIRNPHAFPGGYSKLVVFGDGGVICHKCAKENAKLILQATRRGFDKSREFYGVDVNWESPDVHCGQCGEKIEPEYGDD